MPATASPVSAPLALAKATPPSTAGKLSRTRVNALIDKALSRHSGVWVTGPAGAGKTSAAATYIAARGGAAFWYQLDAEDGDPGTFFHGLGEAFRQWTGIERPLPIYTAGGATDLRRFARTFFAELFHALGQHPILVLDDCHVAGNDSGLFAVLAAALSAGPANTAAIIFLSRNMPPPAMARLVLNDDLPTLGRDALHATPDEAVALVREKSGSTLRREEAEHIVEAVGGWFAALSLIASGESVDSRVGALRSGKAPEVLFDYFTNEVFTEASANEQDLMLRTAFMTRFTGHDAAIVADNPNAADILKGMVRKHYFLDEYIQPEPVYRYHPLFREFLGRKAVEIFGGTEADRLRLQAAERIERSGIPAEAIPHYLACRDWTDAVRLLQSEAEALVVAGRHGTLERWIRMLPESERRYRPWLIYWEAHARLPTEPSEAKDDFLRAMQAFEEAGNRRGTILALAGATDAVFFAHANAEAFDLLIDRLAHLHARWTDFPQGPEEEMALGGFCHALLMRQPDHPLFTPFLERLRTIVDGTSDPVRLTLLGSHLGTWAFWSGDISTMQTLTERLLPFADEPWLPPLLGSLVRMMGAFSAWLNAETDLCYSIIADYETARNRSGVTVWDAHLKGAGAAAALTAGDLGKARGYLKAMKAEISQNSLLDIALYYMLLCWYDMLQGNWVDARRNAQVHQQVAQRFGATLPLACAHLVSSMVAQQFGQGREAEQHLREAQAIAERMDSDLIRFLCQTTGAFHAEMRGDREKALQLVAESFALGRRRGYVNAPLLLPGTMGRLCALALHHGVETEYARRFVERRRLPAPAPDVPGWSWPLEVRAFGGFEILLGGNPLPAGRKLPERPLAILKYLVAHGGEADRDHLLDALWPDSEGDAAGSAFSTNLSRLRGLLGIAEAIRVSGKRVVLDPGYCRLDTVDFERMASDSASAAHLEEAMALYRGPLFGNMDDTPWATAYGESLRALFVSAAVTLAAHKQNGGEAETVIERALRAEPLAEQLYCRLARYHTERGEAGLAQALCRRGRHVFESNDSPAAADRLGTFCETLAAK